MQNFADETSLFTIINDQNATATKYKCKCKVFLLVRSKRLYNHQFSLITNQFNRFRHNNTWVLD